MRTSIMVWVVLLIAALAVCALVACRSDKPIAKDVFYLLVALIPPMVGNLIIIASSSQVISLIGCYLYYLGMDATVMALLKFTFDYCSISTAGKRTWLLVSIPVVIDVVQLLLNPIFGQAFFTSAIEIDGRAYWAMTPLLGQSFHRLVAYGIFIASLIIFIVKTARSPRIYMERYGIILATMIVCGGWQTFYIFSRTPIDRSMIGFGAFGLMVYYFALYYRPFRLLDRLLSRVVSDMTEAVLFFDRDASCIYANAMAEQRFDLANQPDLSSCTDVLAGYTKTFGTGLDEEWTRQTSIITDDGETRYWNLTYRPLADEKGQKVGSFLSIYDRTDEELKLQREQYLRHHDSLTGLFSKEYLYDRIRATIDANPSIEYIIGALDIKDFKLINDIFSSEFGDRVLLWTAQFLREFSATGAVYGRIGGDKFGFLAPAGAIDTEALNARLQGSMYTDAETGVEHPVNLHLGVYEVTERDLPVSIMFDRAFMAINTVKNDYQHHVASYDDTMRDTVLWNQKISGELEEAISTGQIRPYLQPMVNDDGQVEGAEVLVRWIHPEEGFLSPARFIPCFEENGMVARLDEHMWDCACRILKDWESRGIDLFLSVNISPKDFYFLDVAETINGLVAKYGIRPEKLRLEITETVMMNDLVNRLRIVDELRAGGHLVEMDDFGSGYSSLNMLKDIPVDVLKIDMMFLYKTKDTAKAQTILQTIINLSQRLGIPSITEGVETVDQRDMLVDMGCKLFQGYYFAKPMPLDEFEAQYLKAA